MSRTTRKDPALFPYGPETSLSEAKRWLRSVIEEGCVCPACGQLAHASRRRLDAVISASLILIYRAALANPQEPYVHVPSLLAAFPELTRSGGHFGRAAHWGLLESRMDIEGEGAGFHRPTELGIRFVECAVTVPEYVYVYADRKYDEGGKMISIRESLGNLYNYESLMGYVEPEP